MTYQEYTTVSCVKPPYPKRKLVCGVGINDFPATLQSDCSVWVAYKTWYNMLARCYSNSKIPRLAVYSGCTVSSDWLSFSNFETWFTKHHVPEWHLDKDLLFPGNKVYSANTCIFIPKELNFLLTASGRSRGLYPLGVVYHKSRFIARASQYGCCENLGSYLTPQLAHRAWQLAKADYIEFYPVTDPRIRAALDLRVTQLRYDAEHNLITEKL